MFKASLCQRREAAGFIFKAHDSKGHVPFLYFFGFSMIPGGGILGEKEGE